MWLALAVSIGSVAAGAAVVLLGSRSSRLLEPVRTFALVAAGVVVLTQLLPAALGEVGLWALLVFAIALVAPAGFERIVRARTRTGGTGGSQRADSSWIAVELGYIGLLWHKLADGMALGLFGGLGRDGAFDIGVLVAIAAHTVPITGVLVLAYADRYGVRQAIVRAAGLAAATCIGVLVVGATPADRMAAWEPWILAVASGLLLHVIGHDWRAEVPRDRRARLADMVAIAAGVGLVGLASQGRGLEASHGGDMRLEIFSALFELTLETAPILLIGLAIGALLQTFGGQLSTRWLQGGGSLQQAFRGAVVGAPLPICACGVLPLAESLRGRGAGPALVVAFLLATPELGVESFALTVRFLGWPFAVVRLVAAVAVAMAAALVVARFYGGRKEELASQEPMAAGSSREGIGRRVLDHFDELLHHVGPFTLVGLILAAYTQAALPTGAAGAWSGSGFDIFVISLVAVPSYVCAAAATPLAAVLIGKGFSSGAVLAGLLLGPATNLATVGFLRHAYGPRAAWMGLGALILAVWAFSFGANALGLRAVLSEGELGGEHGHSALALVASSVLAAFLLRSIWRNGLRTWLATLGDAFGGGHDHAH